MKSRTIVGLVMVVLGMASIAIRADGASNGHQWAIVDFKDPVRVQHRVLMGAFLVVHDDAKMARREPCTTFYRFDLKKGPRQAVVSFHCVPTTRPIADMTTVTFKNEGIQNVPWTTLLEYQFAGDAEAHGVPDRR